jgi:hypothetical protein
VLHKSTFNVRDILAGYLPADENDVGAIRKLHALVQSRVAEGKIEREEVGNEVWYSMNIVPQDRK